jgi:hypothetical protein
MLHHLLLQEHGTVEENRQEEPHILEGDSPEEDNPEEDNPEEDTLEEDILEGEDILDRDIEGDIEGDRVGVDNLLVEVSLFVLLKRFITCKRRRVEEKD